MPPMSSEDCCQRAEECERLAETATSPHIRETMAYIASRWRALADEAETKDKRAEPARPQHPSE
jgi:hypothetical protein